LHVGLYFRSRKSAALKFCETCIAMKFVDDDDDDDDDNEVVCVS